jgi:hypothetical protein
MKSLESLGINSAEKSEAPCGTKKAASEEEGGTAKSMTALL